VPVIVPVPTDEGVKVTEHLPALSVQGEMVNVPLTPATPKLTVPDGVLAVPPDASVTVAVQVVTLLTTIVAGAHTTLVVVCRSVIVTVVDVGPLPAWILSPP